MSAGYWKFIVLRNLGSVEIIELDVEVLKSIDASAD